MLDLPVGNVTRDGLGSRLDSLRYVFAKGDEPLITYGQNIAVKIVRVYQRDRWRHSVRRRLPSVDRIPLDRPIFVLGLQGGGTTLLARALRRNRAVVSISGDADNWTGTDELGNVRNRVERLPPSLRGAKYRNDLDHPTFGTLHSSVYACDELFPYYRRTAADATTREADLLKRLIREHLAVNARDPRHARFLDKTHTATVRVGFIDALLDGCGPYFVLVLRNPYSTCYRAIRRKPPSYRRDLAYDDRLRHAAEHWANSVEAALADAGGIPRFATVRFEDFVSSPWEVMRALCDAIELEFEETMVPQAGHRFPWATLRSDRKWYPLTEDPWVGEVSERELGIIDERCGPLARRFGYSPAGVTALSTALQPHEVPTRRD